MNDIAISVQNVSKVYRLYNEPLDRLKESLHPLRKKYHHVFYALKNVCFDINKGETVGIIGKNGSGKSTLLKILTGVLTPSSGHVDKYGKVLALLELGAGFNPELTGIENIYFNGTLLGISSDEMDDRLEAILTFADIGEYVYQPVKTYSSGMVMRLGFAVIANMDADILIIDEALAVGDELFQRKCFSRIESIRANGATILFVSHSGSIIIELCDHAMLLDSGEKLLAGKPKQIIGCYQKLLYAPPDKQETIRRQIRHADKSLWESSNAVYDTATERNAPIEYAQEIKESFDPNLKPISTIEYESHGAYIESPAVLALSGEQVNCLIHKRTYLYEYTVRFTKSALNVRFGMLIKNTSGIELGGGVSASSAIEGLSYVDADTTYRVRFRFRCALNPGVYFLNAGVVGNVNGSETYLHRLTDVAMFRVQYVSQILATGIIDFDCYPEVALQKIQN